MAGLGPWPADRRVAVAVSGGADSMCLAWLAAGWGRPLGLIVDHGLRAESAEEAGLAGRRLAGFGVPSRVLTLQIAPGPGVAARARTARYAALADAAASAGLCDILVGHHAGDQAETVLMRAWRASGPAGLAGMAGVTEWPLVRLVRPLLGVRAAELRATLRAHGVVWSEDPSNADPGAMRTGLRARLEEAALRTDIVERGASAGRARAAAERRTASVLARRVALFPEGYALLDPGPLEPEALSALLRALTGAAYPAAGGALARMAADPRPGTLGGLRLMRAGRLGARLLLLLLREARAMRPAIAAREGALWDGRFVLDSAGELPDGAELGAVGEDAGRLRRASRLPACVLATLPALRAPRQGGGRALAVPHVGYFDGWTNASVRLTFCPPNPAAGAPFRVVPVGDAQREADPHVLDDEAVTRSD